MSDSAAPTMATLRCNGAVPSALKGRSGPSGSFANAAPHYGVEYGGVKLRTTREIFMAQPRADLESFFHPNGTAIIGRIDGAATVTADELHDRYNRFGARWYLVNPRGGTAAGIPVY